MSTRFTWSYKAQHIPSELLCRLLLYSCSSWPNRLKVLADPAPLVASDRWKTIPGDFTSYQLQAHV